MFSTRNAQSDRLSLLTRVSNVKSRIAPLSNPVKENVRVGKMCTPGKRIDIKQKAVLPGRQCALTFSAWNKETWARAA
jgi:hypothetical protein